jgi:hypothetical protein
MNRNDVKNPNGEIRRQSFEGGSGEAMNRNDIKTQNGEIRRQRFEDGGEAMKKISDFFNGKTFAVIALAVCLTTAVLVFFRVADWGKYYAVYAEKGGGSFPNNIGGLNFFAYFTEITVCVFTLFLTVRSVYKLIGNADTKPHTAYELNEKNDGTEPLNSDKKTGKINKFLSLSASKIKRLLDDSDINCALATYAAVGFFVVFVGELCGFMTRYADDFFILNFGNIWMHFVVFPLFAVSAFFRKSDKKAEVKKLPLYFVFPLAYFIFSILRGAVIEWYPYPFLDPAKIYGMLCPNKPFDPAAAGLFIAATALIFAAFIAATGFFIIKLYNKNFAKKAEKL